MENKNRKPQCWGKMIWILKYKEGCEPWSSVCSCEHGQKECLRLTRENAKVKSEELTTFLFIYPGLFSLVKTFYQNQVIG